MSKRKDGRSRLLMREGWESRRFLFGSLSFCRLFPVGFLLGGQFADGCSDEDDAVVLGSVLRCLFFRADESRNLEELALLEKLEGRCLFGLAPALAVYKGRPADGLVTVGLGAAD